MKKLLIIEWAFLAFVIAMTVVTFIWGFTAATVQLAVVFGTFAGIEFGFITFDIVMIAKTILEIKNK